MPRPEVCVPVKIYISCKPGAQISAAANPSSGVACGSHTGSLAASVSASVEELWRRVGPFDRLAEWNPAVDSCKLEDSAHPCQVPAARCQAVSSPQAGGTTRGAGCRSGQCGSFGRQRGARCCGSRCWRTRTRRPSRAAPTACTKRGRGRRTSCQGSPMVRHACVSLQRWQRLGRWPPGCPCASAECGRRQAGRMPASCPAIACAVGLCPLCCP